MIFIEQHLYEGYSNRNVGIKFFHRHKHYNLAATLKTGQPSVNGAGLMKFGKVITGASVTIQTDKYLEVEVDGVIRKLAIAE